MDRYNTFMQRFVAGMIDGCIFIPLGFVGEYFTGTDPYTSAAWSLFYLFAWSFYSIFLHGRDGQTLGKRVMNIKVFDVDERSVIGYKRAFYRDAVPIIIELVYIVISFVDPELSEIFWVSMIAGAASILWFMLELVSMLTNAKRRAIHDFMAGSVVIDLRVQQHESLLENFVKTE